MPGADRWIYNSKDRSYIKRRKQVRKHRKQRAVRGWSVFDFWNADSYLLDVIAEIADKFRVDGVGYPSNYTEAEWHEILVKIAKPLHAYTNGEWDCFDNDVTMRLHKEATEALHLFADYFGNFWD